MQIIIGTRYEDGGEKKEVAISTVTKKTIHVLYKDHGTQTQLIQYKENSEKGSRKVLPTWGNS